MTIFKTLNILIMDKYSYICHEGIRATGTDNTAVNIPSDLYAVPLPMNLEHNALATVAAS
jgi:hypothetical protein